MLVGDYSKAVRDNYPRRPLRNCKSEREEIKSSPAIKASMSRPVSVQYALSFSERIEVA